MVDILVVGARGIPDVEGGAEKNAEAVLPLLVERGVSIELLGSRAYLRANAYRGVALTALPQIAGGKGEKLLYNVMALPYAVWTRPRVVHMQNLSPALFLGLYKLFGLKVVLRYGSADHKHAKWGRLGRLALRLCEFQARFADHVMTVSRQYKQDLEAEHGLTRVSVVPNGVDPVHVTEEARAFKRSLGLDAKRYVLAVGRLTVDKSFETIIEALQHVGDRDLHLVIVGGVSEPEYAARLRAMAGDRVHLTGRIDRRLLSALYADAACYVSSSLHEGLSNALLEAVSFGCPVVASDIPANLEMGFAPSTYYRAGDAAQLGERLAAALSSPDAFRPSRERFAEWSAIADQIEAIYLDVAPRLRAEVQRRRQELDSGAAPRDPRPHLQST